MASPRVVTKAAFAQWLTPSEALKVIDPRPEPGSTITAMNVLLERLKGGIVTAASEKSVWDGQTDKPHLYEVIEPADWNHYQPSAGFWRIGDAAFNFGYRFSSHKQTNANHFNVRFDPVAVREMAPPIPPPTPPTPSHAKPMRLEDLGRTVDYDATRGAVVRQVPHPPKPPIPPPAKPKGGRPPKDFWADFWIDICHQIYMGDLKPKTQADLQRAMHEWVENHGHDAGETVIKDAARKLFKAWKLGVGN